MSKQDISLNRVEKVKARTKRNFRTVVVALKEDGTPYKRPADKERRQRQLKNGAERRNGEKIVGHPCTYQTGINTQPGRFERVARDLRNYRRIIADGAYQRGCNSQAYFEHIIDITIASEKNTTKGIVNVLRGSK